MKRFRQFEEEIGGTSTGSVAGAGDDSSTVVMRKKYDRKKKRKDIAKVLKRLMGEKKWSDKYKDSIDCSNPKGFSQRAHCAGKKK